MADGVGAGLFEAEHDVADEVLVGAVQAQVVAQALAGAQAGARVRGAMAKRRMGAVVSAVLPDCGTELPRYGNQERKLGTQPSIYQALCGALVLSGNVEAP